MESVWAYLTYPFEAFAAQWLSATGSRYWWPFILIGGTIALLAVRLGHGRIDPASKTARYWLGPSARVDYFLAMINPALRLILFGGLIAFVATLGGYAPHGESDAATTLGLTLALTLTLFVADDFMRFFTHWLMHRVPFMWTFHKVHHSAESMTFATADRHHFMEIVFVTLPLVGTYALINTIFILTTGIASAPLAIAGANIFLVLFNMGAGAFRHGPVWVSFGRQLEKWLISPAMHHIHHSIDPLHFDKNMGGSLAIWDRLFGTHYSPEGPDELSAGIGLGEEGKPLNTLAGVYLHPFSELARTIEARRKAELTPQPSEG